MYWFRDDLIKHEAVCLMNPDLRKIKKVIMAALAGVFITTEDEEMFDRLLIRVNGFLYREHRQAFSMLSKMEKIALVNELIHDILRVRELTSHRNNRPSILISDWVPMYINVYLNGKKAKKGLIVQNQNGITIDSHGKFMTLINKTKEQEISIDSSCYELMVSVGYIQI